MFKLRCGKIPTQKSLDIKLMLSFSAIIRIASQGCFEHTVHRHPFSCSIQQTRKRLQITYTWLIKMVLVAGLIRVLPLDHLDGMLRIIDSPEDIRTSVYIYTLDLVIQRMDNTVHQRITIQLITLFCQHLSTG